MDLAAPRFDPDPSLSRAEMEAMQRDVADAATFADDGAPTPDAVRLDAPAGDQRTLGGDPPTADGDAVVVGVDQAFTDDRAVSAAVALCGGTVVDESHGDAPLEFPYVPGLLSFREAPAVRAALDGLDADPDLLVVDGSGRIHFRQAGLATHVGVLYDVPAVGVAKNLLCGTPAASLDDPLPEGTRVAIEADADVTAPEGTVLGHAYQSRQYADTASRHVNPLYVSPGHRVSADTATSLVAAQCAGYKLPEPTRVADRAADRGKG